MRWPCTANRLTHPHRPFGLRGHCPSSRPRADTGGMASRATQPLFRLEPGWLFLLPGLALLGATVLIPAQDDLNEARWKRDRAVAIESNRLDRLDHYGSYLEALDRGEDSVVLSLAAAQLNMAPEGRQPVIALSDASRRDASVFPSLEPDPPALPPAPDLSNRSRLARLATGARSRLWLIAGGALCVMLGLLPPVTRAGSSRE